MKLSDAKNTIVSLIICACGLLLIVSGNGFQYEWQKIDIDSLCVNIGTLFLFTAILQWMYETFSKRIFFKEIRSDIISGKNVENSGICDFYQNSKNVDFESDFITSKKVIIGVNYSSKLIDNSIDLLEKRVKLNKNTSIITISPNGFASQYFKDAYELNSIGDKIEKIKSISRQYDRKGNRIKISHCDCIFKYSFIEFDSKIWIVFGTNGLGRRVVPGFFVKHGSPWYEHFSKDIASIQKNEGRQ